MHASKRWASGDASAEWVDVYFSLSYCLYYFCTCVSMCFSFFLFLTAPVACRISQARDQTQATAVTTPDP